VLRGSDGRLRLGAQEESEAEAIAFEAADWVIEMRRFGEDALLDTQAKLGKLEPATMIELADAIAAFHRTAERRPEFGGHAEFGRIVEGVIAGLAASRDLMEVGKLDRLTAGLRSQLARQAALLDRRRDVGYVRLGHGDLHLRNVCVWQGKPTLFDAIEFDDRIAACDVLYDLGFLLMDLEHRGLRQLANAAFNRYMTRAIADDGIDAVEGVALLPLFLAVRAAIRAEVGLFGARQQPDRAHTEQVFAEARAYVDLALGFLSPAPAPLLAIGGLSGTGKSTLAFALAPDIGPAPGALVLRSDALRKALFGLDLFQRLPKEAYAEDVTRRVFASLAAAAGAAVAGGHAVIADAVYLKESQRREIAAAARAAGVPFTGIWLEASRARLEDRVAARTRDVSDATVSIVHMQMQQDPGRLDWLRLSAEGGPQEVVGAAREVLGLKHIAG
jgi:aminoglycoside phosphotransferase family enzyme/predicted kinase